MQVQQTSSLAHQITVKLTQSEARNLYLDLVQSSPLRAVAGDLRNELRMLLDVKMCPVRNPNCKNEVTDSTYRLTCFNNHFRSRQYCSHHVVQVQNGLIDCAQCSEMGQKHRIIFLGLEK